MPGPSKSVKYRQKMKKERPKEYAAFLEKMRLVNKTRRAEMKRKWEEEKDNIEVIQERERQRKLGRERYHRHQEKRGILARQKERSMPENGIRPRDMTPKQFREHKRNLKAASRRRMSEDKREAAKLQNKLNARLRRSQAKKRNYRRRIATLAPSSAASSLTDQDHSCKDQDNSCQTTSSAAPSLPDHDDNSCHSSCSSDSIPYVPWPSTPAVPSKPTNLVPIEFTVSVPAAKSSTSGPTISPSSDIVFPSITSCIKVVKNAPTFISINSNPDKSSTAGPTISPSSDIVSPSIAPCIKTTPAFIPTNSIPDKSSTSSSTDPTNKPSSDIISPSIAPCIKSSPTFISTNSNSAPTPLSTITCSSNNSSSSNSPKHNKCSNTAPSISAVTSPSPTFVMTCTTEAPYSDSETSDNDTSKPSSNQPKEDDSHSSQLSRVLLVLNTTKMVKSIIEEETNNDPELYDLVVESLSKKKPPKKIVNQHRKSLQSSNTSIKTIKRLIQDIVKIEEEEPKPGLRPAPKGRRKKTDKKCAKTK